MATRCLQTPIKEEHVQQSSKFGIYLNAREKKVVRINSPYWIPEPPDWVFLSPEVNATLLKIREWSRDKKLVPDADSITWGAIPLKE